MMTGADPRPPTMPGGWWVACMLDKHGDLWPTGRIWSTEEDAQRDGIDTAAEWNSALKIKRRWWQLWQ